MKIKIEFRALTFDDIPLIHEWFNTPHVQKFYSLRSWTKDEVLAKLTPYISGDIKVFGFIILLNQTPVGYLQSYKVIDFPWPDQNLPEEIINNSIGIDLFIGNENLLKQGLGQKIIKAFLDSNICKKYQYCIVDPDIRNVSAIRCYEKLKFKKHIIIDTEDGLKRPVKLMLFILNI